MANNLITQQVGPVCSQALGLLHYTVLLPRLLYRDCSVSGNIAVGDTVNVRKPAEFQAREFNRTTRQLDIQDIVETTIPVKLDKIWDVSVQLTAEQVTLDLTSFGEQVTNSAVIAIAEKAEHLCVDILDNAGADVVPVPEENPLLGVYSAVAKLNSKMVPTGNRNLVVGTTLAAILKTSDNLLRVDASGSNETLRMAEIGRLAGCTVYESPYVDPEQGYLFAKDAAVFVSRALETMGGGSSAQVSTRSFEGVAMRTAIQYDIHSKSTIASFDVLTGGRELDNRRMVKLVLVPSP